MNKQMTKRIAALALAVCACVGGMGVCAAQNGGTGTAPAAVKPTPDVAQPQYTAILVLTNYLDNLGGGNVSCQASNTVRKGYNAGVKVELQHYDEGWKTIMTWSDSGKGYAAVDEDYTVPSGYAYRLQVTSKSYTSGWSLIETETDYSNIIFY